MQRKPRGRPRTPHNKLREESSNIARRGPPEEGLQQPSSKLSYYGLHGMSLSLSLSFSLSRSIPLSLSLS
eukprot:6981836-Pyramimonas_sp.AAC.1